MKKQYTISGADFQITLPHICQDVMTFAFDNGSQCRVEPCACGVFSEKSALTRKLRIHRSADLLESSAESLRIIPFGCEFEIRRNAVFFDGFALVTVDCAAVSGGGVDEFTLDPVVFSGRWRRLGIDGGGGIRWQDAVDEPAVLWNDGRPPLRMLAEGDDGSIFECGCGEDLWRHHAGADMPGCSAAFTVTGDSKSLRIDRRMFSFDKSEDVEIPRRSWRFSYYIAWHTGAGGKAVSGQEAALDQLDLPESAGRTGAGGVRLQSCCMAAPALRRRLRDAVRSAGGSLTLTGYVPGICFDPSHPERPSKGSLMHWDLPEAAALYIWGNRQLAAKGGVLTIKPGENSAAASVLGRRPSRFKEEL